MQVATLFRETSNLLSATVTTDAQLMESTITKHCSGFEITDDGYETLATAGFRNNSMDRIMGGVPHLDPNNMRHLGLEDHYPHHHLHHRQSVMKMESFGDPYRFVDEMANNAIMPHPMGSNHSSQAKKRGRRKKPSIKNEEIHSIKKPLRTDSIMDTKERKRHDRFNGLSEAEVSQRTLPDHLTSNLDIVIVGINPGLFAAFKGHHYAGPGNHFWKCLYMSGLVPEPLTADDDYSLIHYGIGFTNMVQRPTKGSADLTRREIKQGSQVLLEKIQKYRPKVAVFNGKLIYEVFSGKKDFPFGKQSEFVEGTNTYIWVMPSSSARCAQLPRAADKVPFYQALKKFRDYLNGLIAELDDSEVVFNDSKPISKASNAADTKQLLDSSSTVQGEEQGFLEKNHNGKKKRGRPRKGMEKQGLKDKSPKVDSKTTEFDMLDSGRFDHYGGVIGSIDSTHRLLDAQRKRRGRPKKSKVLNGSPTSSSVSNKTSPESLESNTQASLGTCQMQTASSVSSGYSTGTAGSNEERRRDENGSLSNAGSGGPSPSHHSFTTQSDLSSEISAAISCGSPQPSPNTQVDNVFDSIHGHPQRSDSHMGSVSKVPTSSSHTSMSQTCPPPSGIFTPQGVRSSNSSRSDSSFSHYPYYDNRPNGVHRTQPYQSNNGSRDSTNEGSGQTGANFQNQYEPPKSLDVSTKSLSGLESLVDQIPSIGENDPLPINNNTCLPGLVDVSASQPHLPPLGSVSGSVSYPNPYGEAGSGFLPYSHHSTAPTYASPATHYPTPPYYASDLNSTFPVNSLAATYCPPFSYPGYHSQYSTSPAGYPHPSGLHLSTSGYTSPYGTTSPYAQNHPNNSSNSTSNQRYTSRLNLRPDGMDLGHMGYGGF